MSPATQPRPEMLALGDELGVGAVATVYRAVDRETGEHYAIKLLHDRNARDPRAARRFTREAELARTLVDPHIVGVHGAVELDGRRALVMELVEGPTLAELIATQAPIARPRMLRLARDIARGLSIAHAGGVIHRDLKPANVLVARAGEPGEIAKIADFGMARATSFAGVDREAMTVLGTPDYMAPETLDPLAVDPRTDLYALGCIMVEMATGRPPFSAPTPFAVLDAHRTRAPPKLGDAYGPGVRELVARLLAKQPIDRPYAASAVVDSLDALLADTTGNVSRALVARPRDLLAAAVSGRCARCGAPVVHGVRVCLECGLLRVEIERGRWTVFVVGPGLVGDKFDSARRDALLTWLRANEDAGLDIGSFAERIPRLPFPLVVGISETSARTLTETLLQLDIHAEPRPGGRLAHGAMAEKMFRISARRTRIALPLLLLALPLMLLFLVAALPLVPLYLAVVAWWTSKPALRIGPAAGERLALPPQVDQRLRAVERAAPHVSDRHRPELRAVVQRVMALIDATPAAQRAEIDAEMAHALAVATVATERMSELDAQIAHPEFDAGEPEHRRDLQERDMWAARMLELTATLDTLVARLGAARSALHEREHDEELEQLRHRVEALEQVQRG